MKSTVLGLWAARRRGQGHYDKRTLGSYASAWRHSGSPRDLLAYALFRRDLGKPLPQRWLAPLCAGLDQLSANQRCLALGLLAERGPQTVVSLPAGWLAEAALRLPALAAHPTGRRATPALTDRARLHLRQPEWRARFGEWATAQGAAQGLCVVGNAAQLQGSGLGPAIDAASAVVRFNGGLLHREAADDVGRRTDVWVVSPGYRGIAPAGVAWVVVTGPDMRYRLQNWTPVLPLLQAGVPVLTLPLGVWRSLVAVLQAPPSAGVCVLAWLAQLGGGWHGVRSVGIGPALQEQGRYPREDARQRASARHAWPGERALLARWQAEGLQTGPTRSPRAAWATAGDAHA